ncbi:hypothetical protein B0H17DRAFT_1190524 [Mycena rosella]|uniref:Uncharacterized protein n=1 Tax=Mycena rosella TaxID=1033263 RepID=A0AAD7H3X8_MYCRO|nr:hypothetical protein B0H17DRAFT_1190524 [Mycena rosella]
MSFSPGQDTEENREPAGYSSAAHVLPSWAPDRSDQCNPNRERGHRGGTQLTPAWRLGPHDAGVSCYAREPARIGTTHRSERGLRSTDRNEAEALAAAAGNQRTRRTLLLCALGAHAAPLCAGHDVVDQAGRYVYPTSDTPTCELATWGSWFVHPQHIGEYRVPGDKVLVSKERKELIDRQWERNLVRQEESRRKREFERQARSTEPYPKHKSKNEMRAAILARSQETAGGVPAANAGARATARTRNRPPNRAAPPQAQVEQALPVTTAPAAPVQPPVPVQSTSDNIPPISTIDPAELTSTSHNDPPVPDNLDNMSHEEFLHFLDTASNQGSVTQGEDTVMGDN